MESRAPAVSRTAPTTPEVTSATAQQDTDSTQTDVAVMVCLTLSLNVDGIHTFMTMNTYFCLILGEFQFDSEHINTHTHAAVFVLV